tara:strand:+ start:113 stop:460 length:348 start_codon:yes stop_codon:yes gene_type:complete
LVRQLANLGFTEVTPHQRADHALAMLETGSEHIDLVFCDLQMPLMDGVECVRNQLGPGINKVVDKLLFCVVGCIGFCNSSELELELNLGSLSGKTDWSQPASTEQYRHRDQRQHH